MRLQIKIGFCGMNDIAIDDCARKAVTTFSISSFLVPGEKANVVSFSDNNYSDFGLDL